MKNEARMGINTYESSGEKKLAEIKWEEKQKEEIRGDNDRKGTGE